MEYDPSVGTKLHRLRARWYEEEADKPGESREPRTRPLRGKLQRDAQTGEVRKAHSKKQCWATVRRRRGRDPEHYPPHGRPCGAEANVKMSEENSGEHPWDLGVRKNILNATQKVLTQKDRQAKLLQENREPHPSPGRNAQRLAASGGARRPHTQPPRSRDQNRDELSQVSERRFGAWLECSGSTARNSAPWRDGGVQQPR